MSGGGGRSTTRRGWRARAYTVESKVDMAPERRVRMPSAREPPEAAKGLGVPEARGSRRRRGRREGFDGCLGISGDRTRQGQGPENEL